jgi:RNA polymerase sigma factor (sigma-70 family)
LSWKREEGRRARAAEGLAPLSTDPVYRSEQVFLQRNIHEAIAKLPERQRRIFLLKEVEGYQQAEIASAMGIPVGTVKSLMHRAVKSLRRELAANASKGVSVKCDAKMLSV